MNERHSFNGALNQCWETEGITQESVNNEVKLRRKQRSIFYRWWLKKQIKKCQKQLKSVLKCRLIRSNVNINNPLQAAKISLQQKKYVDELAYIDAMRFNKKQGRM